MLIFHQLERMEHPSSQPTKYQYAYPATAPKTAPMAIKYHRLNRFALFSSIRYYLTNGFPFFDQFITPPRKSYTSVNPIAFILRMAPALLEPERQ